MKFVEASFVMPLFVLILVFIINFSISLYINLETNVNKHIEEIKTVYESNSTEIIRGYEALTKE